VTPQGAIQGITEGDIANYLAVTPGFFERHAELLSSVQLTSPHGQRAVSLQERQMQMLRERIKGLEQKIVEMIRNSLDNAAIAERLHRWTRTLLLPAEPAALPARLLESLQQEFLIPQAAVRLWGLHPAFDDEAYAQPTSADAVSFASSLTLPYCGVNAGFEAARWLGDAGTVLSLAMIPLRDEDTCWGLLVLGSPDPTRFAADLGVDFLVRVGELAAASLSRLRPA
jgi:uncharacterized protein YigA (DUF484 family)